MPEASDIVRYAKFSVFAILVLVGVLVIDQRNDEPADGFRLRAESLLPADGLVESGTMECPTSPAQTPREWNAAGILADEVNVDEGEVIGVRFRVDPFQGPIPDSLDFDARWPTDVIDPTGPTCAFVLAADRQTAQLTWTAGDDGVATFALDSLRPYATTIVEVWLTAQRPEGARIFSSSLSTDNTSDTINLDPLGGTISVEQRASAVAQVTVIAREATIVAGQFSVTAVVENQVADARARDVNIEIDGGNALMWTTSADGCDDGPTLRCGFGDLRGEAVEVTATATLADNWRPVFAGDCPASGAAGELGACVTVAATTATTPRSSTLSAAAFVVVEPTNTGSLTIGLVDPPAVAQRGVEHSVRIYVAAADVDDLGLLDVVGNDCDSFVRTEGPVDDNDNFLEPGEIWWFDCNLVARETQLFRFDVAATAQDASRVTQSFEGVLTIIDSAVEVGVVDLGEGRRVTVMNSGLGVLADVALSWPDCMIADESTDQAAVLAEGEQLVYECDASVAEQGELTVFATDLSGGVVVTGVTDS